MPSLLIQHADLLVTMDADRREIADGAVLVEDNAIAWVGATADLDDARRDAADEVLSGVCAEFCGLDHGRMRFTVRVVTADEFDAWFEDGAGHAR